MQSKPIRFLLPFAALIFLPFLFRKSPESRATTRVRHAVFAAQASLQGKGPGTEKDVQEFARALKAIDPNGVPLNVAVALSNYISAVEANAEVRRKGGDIVGANDAVVAGQSAFYKATDSPRNQPF